VNQKLETVSKLINYILAEYNVEIDLYDHCGLSHIELHDQETGEWVEFTPFSSTPECEAHFYSTHHVNVLADTHQLQIVCSYCGDKKEEVHEHEPSLECNGHLTVWKCTNEPSCGDVRREIT